MIRQILILSILLASVYQCQDISMEVVEDVLGNEKEMAEPTSYTFEFDRTNNPLNIHVDSKRSNNYFLVLGDWGSPNFDGSGSCQKEVADSMNAYVNEQKSAGKNLLFIAALGDNFYWTGNGNCDATGKGMWQSVWSKVYGSLTQDYYWFSVMGNHDYGGHDPYSMCPWKLNLTHSGNQKRNCAPPKYYMPDNSYFYRFDELSFEFLGLDTNSVDCPNGIGGNGASGNFEKCGGSGPACRFLGLVQDAGAKLLQERQQQSEAKNFYATQHYDNVCQNWVFKNLGQPKNAQDIKCAHGHTHQNRCVVGKDPECKVMMSGAGGGCCGEANPYGFSAVHFTDDFKMETITNVKPISPSECKWSMQSKNPNKEWDQFVEWHNLKRFRDTDFLQK